MRNFVFFLAVLFFCSYSTGNCPAVKTEGMYVYKIDEESSAVIRFYSDGLVLVSSSVNDYSKVLTWFNRDPENASRVLKGKWKTGKGCSISFSVEGETGKQKFTGRVISDTALELHIFNPGDKKSTDRTYTHVNP